MSCETTHIHPLSALTMRSAIEGARNCVIADDPCAHFVEITNKGSNWYRIKVAGMCSPPLRFLGDHGWTEHWSSDDNSIGPVRRLPHAQNRRRYRQGIGFSDDSPTVEQEHAVDVKVTVTGVADYRSEGGWKPADIPLTTSELMLLCRRHA